MPEKKEKITICFDVTWMDNQNQIGGGFQYAEVLIAAMTKNTAFRVLALVGKKGEGIFDSLKKFPNFKTLIYDGVPASFYKTIKKEKIGLIHAPIPYFTNYYSSVPMVATVHDLQHYHFPSYVSKEEMIYREKNYKKVVEESQRVIVSYQHVKKDIVKYFHAPASKIDICRIGYDFSRQVNFSKWLDVKKKYHLPEKYLFYSANTWQHKNHLNLIKALKIVQVKYHLKIPLICIGQQYPDFFPKILDEIKKNKLEQSVRFLGYIPEEEKLLILKNAVLAVIPTLYEGGSLPLMEAMSYQVPVISSNVTSLPEIMGDKKYLFEPSSVKEMAEKIKKMLLDENFKNQNITNSLNQCESLKWEDTVREFYGSYKSAILEFKKENFVFLTRFHDWKKYVFDEWRIKNPISRRLKEVRQKIRESYNLLIFKILISNWLIKFFKKVAIVGTGSNKCLKEGFLPMAVNYHSPIPDLDDLKKREVWDKKSTLAGIDFNLKGQLSLLKKLGQKFGQECDWPLTATGDETQFYANNCSFGFGCAAALHTVVREFKPKRIIEIGSGNSSLVIAAALKLNKGHCQYDIIDPYPLDFVKNLRIHRLYPKRVELLNPDFFDDLEENDILFIDSGHAVRIGSDVNYLYLEILPRLKPGVIVHIHDIALPYEYSKVYATQEVFRQFWTEQYLLQAFLINNKEFEILLGMNYLMTDRIQEFRAAFPLYNPEKHQYISGSFWLRRKKEK